MNNIKHILVIALAIVLPIVLFILDIKLFVCFFFGFGVCSLMEKSIKELEDEINNV